MGGDKEVSVKITTDVDDENVKDLEELINEINNSEIELSVETDDTSLEDAEDKVEDIDGKEVTVEVNADTSAAEESISGLEEALTALTAGAGLAGMENMVATAGNIQDSWNRLGLTFGEVTGQMKTDISEAGEATGRSGGLIRQYFNDMGIAGVKNTELLQQSFEALSGRAYQTGNSIESMEQKMKMMVMSGNAGARQLTALGISAEDLGRAMGVSADEASKMFKTLSQEERLKVLTQAMGDGKKANEEYKNSWQGLKDQVDRATGALIGAVGSAILPILVPAMTVAANAITALANGFKALPAPIQGVVGGVLAVVMGFLALRTVISTVQAITGAINLAKTAMTLWNTVTQIATVLQAALNAVMMMNPYVLIAVAIIALIAALVYLYTTCEPVRNAIDGLGQALWGLGEAIYGGIAGAIQWLIDGFTWLWNTISGMFASTSGDGINWLATMAMVMMGPIGWIMLLITHWNSIVPAVSGALSGMYNAAVNWFRQTASQVSSFGANLISQFGSAASSAASSFISGISGLASSFAAELDGIISDALNFAGELGSAMWNAANHAWQQFLAGLGIHSPGIMQRNYESEMLGIIQHARDTEAPLGSAMRSVGESAVNNFDITGLNTNTVPTSATQASGNGVTMNIVINGDVDNEERMERFAEYIINRMNWNNETAGRNV